MSENTSKIEAGRSIELSDGRLVFVGKFPGREQLAIGFKNTEGELTKLTLSMEAAAALSQLISDPSAGVESSPPRDSRPHVYQWKAIAYTPTAEQESP